MIEYHLNPVAVPKTEREVLLEAKMRLFSPGIQLRMIGAILLTAFALILPLFLLSWMLLLMLAFELFVTFPMIYGLFRMADRAVKGDTVSVRDVFCAFSASYVRALTTVSCAAVLFSLALAVPILTVRGTITLHAAVLSIPHTAPYAVTLFVPYAILILLSVFLMLFVSMPAYLFISIRIHAPSTSLLRAAVQSASYLKRDLRYYLKMRGQLLLLDLCSVFSVCALFPIYTIPLHLLANAMYAARLSEQYGNAVSTENHYTLL
jgi:hypothetical protein